MRPSHSHFPLRPNRRSLLRFGGVTLAGAASALFGRPVWAEVAAPARATADSVLFLWLPGGVTHHESFDPKPDAPEEIRGDIRPIETNVKGVRFAEVMPCLARHMDKLAVVRSFAAGTDDHFKGQAYALSGHNAVPDGILSQPNFGCLIHHQLGATGGLPGYVAVPGSTRPGPPDTDMFVPAWLGQGYAPFCTGGEPRKPDFTVQDLAPPSGVSSERFERRRTLRGRVESRLGLIERAAQADDVEALYGRAVELLTSPKLRGAFDVHREPEKSREKYGMSKVGQRCLLARRLIDAGARFVMVDYGYDWGEYNNLWDNHCAVGQNQPPIFKMVKEHYHLPAVDRAFAALLEDLAASGRLERTLVVYLTEFGRTPKVNSNGGRDHWGHAGSIFYAGGGVRGGQVIGETDNEGAAVAPVYPGVGVDPHRWVTARDGRPMPIQSEGEPIPVF